jgi:hypothetical protein
LSHASSPTPSLEDYKSGPGDLTVFPADPSKIHVPVVFEPIATCLRTTRPREVTNVPMTPAAIDNLAGATKRDSCVPRKHLQPLTKRASKKKVLSKNLNSTPNVVTFFYPMSFIYPMYNHCFICILSVFFPCRGGCQLCSNIRYIQDFNINDG